MARKATRKAAAGGGSLLWLQGLVCGAVLAFATPIALLLCVLLAPAVLAAVMDTMPNRAMTRAVFFAALAFTLGPLWHLILAGRGMQQAVDLISDPGVLGPAWLAGACGWALCEVLPVVLRSLAELQATARMAALKSEAAALRAEWDLPAEDVSDLN
jgi:hypothetical protein